MTLEPLAFSKQRQALQARYPTAFIEPYDNEVLALTKAGWEAMHAEFLFWLGQTYREEVGDCDDFMREFHAYVKRRHRAGEFKAALGCYDLIYNVGGDPLKKHAINVVWVIGDDGERYLSELEPQPNGGLFQCTDIEKLSALACLG